MDKPCIKCGMIPVPIPPRYLRSDYRCTPCHNKYCRDGGYKGGPVSKEWMRNYLKNYAQRPEVKKRNAEKAKRYRADPKHRYKHEARWKVSRALASGKLLKNPCACGSMDVEAHHSDYSKPLDVLWLCRGCHVLEHRKIKAEGGK